MESIISVDSGSSFMKAYDGKNHVKFPAVIKECKPEDLDTRQIKVRNKYYLVGESARTASNVAILSPHITPGFHGSPEQLVQICYAFELLKLGAETDCHKDILVVSLPYSDAKNKTLKKQIRNQRVFEWSVIDRDDVEHTRRVEFGEVRIVAQGVGAINKYYDKTPERPRIVMLCDIGACTTDVVIVQKNNDTQQYDYCGDACVSIENFNVHWFKDEWVSAILREVRGIDRNKKYDYYNLMQQAIDGSFTMQLGDRQVNTKESFEATRSIFSEALKTRLYNAAKHLWFDIHKIIFTGGGAALVKPDLFDKRVVTLDEWANVDGQYLMCVPTEEQEEQQQPNTQTDQATLYQLHNVSTTESTAVSP